MNYNYPFFTKGSKGWSIGYNVVDSILPKVKISNNIITSKELNITQKNNESIFLADPFFVRKNDSTYLFVENQIKNDYARIDVFVSGDNKKFIYKGVALDEKFHLSYPQVFSYNNKFYMLPETKRSNQVLLYSTDNFPYDWKISDTLIKNVRYKDPSLLILKDNCYMFMVDDDMKFYIYHSKNLKGPWKEYKNHTTMKYYEARPGGRIFKMNNKFYIPIQNSSKGYGTGVSLYEIKFEKNKINLVKAYPFFLKGMPNIKVFNKGMHHIDIQKIGDKFLIIYDGDRKTDENIFNWKRVIKYSLVDFGLY